MAPVLGAGAAADAGASLVGLLAPRELERLRLQLLGPTPTPTPLPLPLLPPAPAPLPPAPLPQAEPRPLPDRADAEVAWWPPSDASDDSSIDRPCVIRIKNILSN